MNSSKQHLGPDDQHDPVQLTIRLDDDEMQLASCRLPGHFEVDTAALPNGPQMLHIQAVDNTGVPDIRSARFAVGNGPAISICGNGGGDI